MQFGGNRGCHKVTDKNQSKFNNCGEVKDFSKHKKEANQSEMNGPNGHIGDINHYNGRMNKFDSNRSSSRNSRPWPRRGDNGNNWSRNAFVERRRDYPNEGYGMDNGENGGRHGHKYGHNTGHRRVKSAQNGGKSKNLDTGIEFDYDAEMGSSRSNARNSGRRRSEAEVTRGIDDWSGSHLVGYYDLDGSGTPVNVHKHVHSRNLPSSSDFDANGPHGVTKLVTETKTKSKGSVTRRLSIEIERNDMMEPAAEVEQTRRDRKLMQQRSGNNKNGGNRSKGLQRQPTRRTLFARDGYDEDYRSLSASSCGSKSGDKKMEPCRNKRFEPYQMTRSKNSKDANEASRFDEYYGPCRGKGRDVSLADSHAIPYENKNVNNNKNNNKNGGNNCKNFSNNSMQSPDIKMNSNAKPSTNFTQAGLESPKSRQFKLSVASTPARIEAGIVYELHLSSQTRNRLPTTSDPIARRVPKGDGTGYEDIVTQLDRPCYTMCKIVKNVLSKSGVNFVPTDLVVSQFKQMGLSAEQRDRPLKWMQWLEESKLFMKEGLKLCGNNKIIVHESNNPTDGLEDYWREWVMTEGDERWRGLMNYLEKYYYGAQGSHGMVEMNGDMTGLIDFNELKFELEEKAGLTAGTVSDVWFEAALMNYKENWVVVNCDFRESHGSHGSNGRQAAEAAEGAVSHELNKLNEKEMEQKEGYIEDIDMTQSNNNNSSSSSSSSSNSSNNNSSSSTSSTNSSSNSTSASRSGETRISHMHGTNGMNGMNGMACGAAGETNKIVRRKAILGLGLCSLQQLCQVARIEVDNEKEFFKYLDGMRVEPQLGSFADRVADHVTHRFVEARCEKLSKFDLKDILESHGLNRWSSCFKRNTFILDSNNEIVKSWHQGRLRIGFEAKGATFKIDEISFAEFRNVPHDIVKFHLGSLISFFVIEMDEEGVLFKNHSWYIKDAQNCNDGSSKDVLIVLPMKDCINLTQNKFENFKRLVWEEINGKISEAIINLEN